MQTRRRWLGWLATCGLALGLTLVFWLPIWCGAGFVGGDIYSYFFPQKVIYSEALHAGELPLWNDRAGFGYPLLAESQTGIFYPPNLVLYRWLDAHSGFHVSFLLHYFVAFVFASATARRLGLSLVSSWLTALVYVYGWFPPRTCVEWAIIGGTWLPAALWCAESFLSTRLWRFAIGLSGVLAVQLFAGHFQIAWLTLLLLAVYVPTRVWWIGIDRPHDLAIGVPPSNHIQEPMSEVRKPLSHPWRITFVSYAAMACGLSLAAVQLLPTYELKERSQRATVGKEHELDFGSIPPWYWSQLIWPSHWYSPLTNREQAFAEHPPLGHSRTNSAEAHLFFGLAPLLLIIVGVGGVIRKRLVIPPANRLAAFWIAVAIGSGVYTSGWLLPLTRHLPGFSYFQGPGRFGLLTTWAAAMLVGMIADGRAFSNRTDSAPSPANLNPPPRWLTATMMSGAVWALASAWLLAGDADFLTAEMGFPHPLVILGSTVVTSAWVMGLLIVGCIAAGVIAWSIWQREISTFAWRVLLGVIFAATTLVFWLASRRVTFTHMVDPPPLISLQYSPVRKQREISTFAWRVLLGVIFAATTLEFWLVSRLVTFTHMVDPPPLISLQYSPVRKVLHDAAIARPALRLFAPGANLPSTLGISSVPTYLTFGPAEYVDDSLRIPTDSNSTVVPTSNKQLEWLLRNGVTHVLCFEPSPQASAMQLLWQGDDPFLNRAWGRLGQSLFLYELNDSLGRLQFRSLSGEVLGPNHWMQSAFVSRANSVTCSVEIAKQGTLTLTDLDYPGWSVTVDGQPAESLPNDGHFRSVQVAPGSHLVAWSYQPNSVLWGAAISVSTLLFLATVAHLRFWHHARFSLLDEVKSPVP